MAALVQSMTSEKGSSQRGLRSTGMQPAWGAGTLLQSPVPPCAHSCPPTSYFESQQLLLLGVRNKEERKVVLFFFGGVGWSGVVLQRVRRMLP